MARRDEVEIPFRIVIERPVPGVLHSLQAGKDEIVDPKSSADGAPLQFDFAVRVAPGPKFSGGQVRREGPVRRFVYVRVGQYAGQADTPWARRMKIDIHDLDEALLDQAIRGDGGIELVVDGTLPDGSPACATVRARAGGYLR